MTRLLFLVLLMAACSSSQSNDGAVDFGAGGVDAWIPTDGPGVTTTGDTTILTMTPFPVAAGQEVFKCQSFANPFGGDTEIQTFESHMTAGSHHLLLLYEPGAVNAPLKDCSGLTFGPMLYGAQLPDSQAKLPTGVATLIGATQGFNLVVHYLNASNQAVMANVQVALHKAAAGTVTQHAGVFFFNNISALFPGVAPGATKTISASYTTPHALNIVYATGHMHARTTNLTAKYGSSMLYTTDSWDNAPFQEYSPAVALPAGTSIDWSCTIHNTTTTTLVFGESANSNEMCIFNGQYYPVVDNANPTLNIMR